jgi:hypothetical protein
MSAASDFLERRTAMTLPIARPVSGLSEEELDAASGGMKWDKNYVSNEVIDARGGYITWGGWTFTFDVNGKTSSVTPPTLK